MNAIITDAQALAKIRVVDVSRYLRRRGWTERSNIEDIENDEQRPRFRFWAQESPGQESFEVLVPESAEYRDYAQRIADLLADLARYERRSQLTIVRRLDARRRLWRMAGRSWIVLAFLLLSVWRIWFRPPPGITWVDVAIETASAVILGVLALYLYEWMDHRDDIEEWRIR